MDLFGVASPAERVAHEQRVEAFMASVPKRRRQRVEERYSVLEGRQLRRVLHNESGWPGDLLELVPVETGDVINGGGYVKRSGLKQAPGYGAGSLAR